MPIPAVHDI